MSNLLRTLSALICLMAAPNLGRAADSYNVAAYQSVTINEHGICRLVMNGGPLRILVPTRSANEWAIGAGAFLNNTEAMNKVSALSCDTIQRENLISDSCYQTEESHPHRFSCRRTSGPLQGEFVSNSPIVLSYAANKSQMQRCILDGYTGGTDSGTATLAYAAPGVTSYWHMGANVAVDADKVMQMFNRQFPVEGLQFKPGSNECYIAISFSIVQDGVMKHAQLGFRFRR